jgi:hypothetical protein
MDVTFTIPARPDIDEATVVGDFNDWSTTATTMARVGETFSATVTLPAGRRYQFKYLLNGERWENDWAADEYVANRHGGEDSVVDLTDTTARNGWCQAPTVTRHRAPATATTRPVRPITTSSQHERPARPRPERGFEGDGQALAALLRFARELAANHQTDEPAGGR